MSETLAQHRLDGLEPDNLLAFLALLGLLRALDVARPEWRARAYWQDKPRPLRPVLALAAPQAREAVVEAAAEGATMLAVPHAFDRKDLNHNVAEAHETLTNANGSPLAETLLGALLSDGAARDDGRIWPTPFCFVLGQGHQHFLERLADVPNGKLPSALSKLRKPPNSERAGPHRRHIVFGLDPRRGDRLFSLGPCGRSALCAPRRRSLGRSSENAARGQSPCGGRPACVARRRDPAPRRDAISQQRHGIRGRGPDRSFLANLVTPSPSVRAAGSSRARRTERRESVKDDTRDARHCWPVACGAHFGWQIFQHYAGASRGVKPAVLSPAAKARHSRRSSGAPWSSEGIGDKLP